MAEHVAFPSINQFRNTIKLVSERAQFQGLPLPTLLFIGTVKLHGTNAGIQFTEDGQILAQSRSSIITPEADNAGFAAWVKLNEDEFVPLWSPGRTIFGEWCGGNIQKGVAINGLPKMFVVFAVREGDGRWLPALDVKAMDFSPAKNIYDFPHFLQAINFARPEEIQNNLRKLTELVEAECPVGAALGSKGVGEGIVWWPVAADSFNTWDLQFKVKGEKHSETKVKTLAAVDVEKIESIRELAESVATPHRLEKRLQALKEEGVEVDIRNTGLFLKSVALDVLKEEKDTIEASGLSTDDVMKRVSRIAKDYFMKQLG